MVCYVIAPVHYNILARIYSEIIVKVLFKRKPVQFLKPPHAENDQEVRIYQSAHDAPRAPTPTCSLSQHRPQIWHIAQTGEIFVTYEDYLNRYVEHFYKTRLIWTDTRLRLDFYKQVCCAANWAQSILVRLTAPATETIHMSNYWSLRSELFRGSRVGGEVMSGLYFIRRLC